MVEYFSEQAENQDTVRKIAHILKEVTWKRTCFRSDYREHQFYFALVRWSCSAGAPWSSQCGSSQAASRGRKFESFWERFCDIQTRFWGCANFYESLGEFFEMMDNPILRELENSQFWGDREKLVQNLVTPTICSVYGILNWPFGPVKIPFFIFPLKQAENSMQDRMVRVFFKTGGKSVFLLTSEGYRIMKHLYQAFVSHQAQNGVQNHLGTDCAVCDEDAWSCKIKSK